MAQQVSHRPIKCQYPLWSQTGTKVNGSHHGDNPLLRPTGIQIATKSYATLQAMATTNVKTVHQTSLLHIESNFDRLGVSVVAYPRPAFSATNWINYAPISFDQQVQVSQGHTDKLNPKYNDTVPLCLKIRETMDGNGAGDICGTTVWNKKYFSG